MEYIKEFDKWNIKKQVINRRLEQPYFKERQIWWCSLGCNIGTEEDGKNEEFERPIVIFRSFGEGLIWAIPLTTTLDLSNSRINYTFTCDLVTRTALLNQMRPVSGKRLLRYISTVSYEDFQIIRKYLMDLI